MRSWASVSAVFCGGFAVGVALFFAGKAGASVCYPEGYGWIYVHLVRVERNGDPVDVAAQGDWPSSTMIKTTGNDDLLFRIDGTDMVLSP